MTKILFFRILREESCVVGWTASKSESDFLDFIRYGDANAIRAVLDDPGVTVTVRQNWHHVKKCAKEAVGTANMEIIR